MSSQHRPLEQIRREARRADRARHLRRNTLPAPDMIDTLDTSGHAYHHGGPYDATLASRNRIKKYAPIEAVRESNLEALRATPREFIQDSLTKRMPLHGTATVPAGMRDLSGKVMVYEEGVDLMRDGDAPGGPYRRYDGILYHPYDLKGKGEPSYSLERAEKERKARLRHQLGDHRRGDPRGFELQPYHRHRHHHRGSDSTARYRPHHSPGTASAAAAPPGASLSPVDAERRRAGDDDGKAGNFFTRRWSGLRRMSGLGG